MSDLAILDAFDQPADHLADHLKLGSQRRVTVTFYQPLPTSQFQQRDALLRRSPCDRKEVLPVGLGKATVALSEVGADGYGRTVELICEKVVSAWEVLCRRYDLVGEIDSLLGRRRDFRT